MSLLSLPKYAAIVNNASDREMTIKALTNLGAHNIISLAAPKVAGCADGEKSVDVDSAKSAMKGNGHSLSQDSDVKLSSEQSRTSVSDDRSRMKLNSHEPKEKILSHSDSYLATGTLESQLSEGPHTSGTQTRYEKMDNVLTPDAVLHSKDLQYFVPTEQVFSETEQLLQEEVHLSKFEERPISITVLPGRLPALPASLQVLTYPAGDVSDFPRPKADTAGLLNYYLLDAASILPVIALDLQPHDSVLDLCAAPGGKTLAMLQMIVAQGGHLTSNDVSPSRVRRLETVLRSYLSASLRSEFVTLKDRSGLKFREPVFSKVLVDVPCNSDRHVVMEEENNLFKPDRIKERLQMTTLQKDLLLAGIQSCKPGGSVVYSTCTLAAVQNDGVVQAAVEELWETSDIDVAVEDLSPMADMFLQTFSFHLATRFGQLVLPCLTNNFGPMYFCKLKRLS